MRVLGLVVLGLVMAGPAAAQAPLAPSACAKLSVAVERDLKQASYSAVNSLPTQAANFLASASMNLNLMTAQKCPLPAEVGADLYVKQAMACSVAAIPARSTRGLPECDQDKWQRER